MAQNRIRVEIDDDIVLEAIRRIGLRVEPGEYSPSEDEAGADE